MATTIELPTYQCPLCGHAQTDFDGCAHLVFVCERVADGHCTYCEHPSATGCSDGRGGTLMVCDACGAKV